MNRVNNPRYCKYHRIVSHHIGKCFVLKELIMKLAQQGRMELDLEDTTATHTTAIVFGSFDLVPLQATHSHFRPCLSHTRPSTQPSLGASDQIALTDNEEGWTPTRRQGSQDHKPQSQRWNKRENTAPTTIGDPKET
ncbi:hypothetical protein ACFX16_040183 [Malus domestica]